ncbi:MAG: DNA polymerase III subunit gamma/tau [Simkaniaceae bacterium]
MHPQAIFRRFRPQTFGEVSQQTAIVTTLKNAIRLQRTSHAYLFSGSRGTGKTTLARIFAKALNCENLTEETEPCNQCSSCMEIMQGRSLDVLEIDGASNRGIDDIRNLNETAGYAPSRGKYKIYIIDEVHMLTKEAFNALLKLLEEPPSQVKFFFATTEPHKILPTILSRCQRFDLSRISEEAILQKLQKIAGKMQISIDDKGLQLIARHAEGSLRDAESMLDQICCFEQGNISEETVAQSLGIVEESLLFTFDQAAAKGDLSYAFTLTDQIFSTGKNLGAVLDSLMEHYSEILKYKMGLSQNSSYEFSAGVYTNAQCLYILDYLFSCSQKMTKSALKRISLEIIFLHILKSLKRVPLEKIAERLVHLEKSIQASPDNAAPESKPVSPDPKEPAEKISPSPPLLEKESLQEEAASSHAEPLTAPPEPAKGNSIEKSPAEKNVLPQSPSPKKGRDYETLLHFAAVELNGVVKK